MLSGGTQEGAVKQTTALVRNIDSQNRSEILKQLGTSTVPAKHVAAMKANLNIPWHQLRLISRWLRTFNVNLGSEKQARLVSKEWTGAGLVVEMAPITGSNFEVVQKPWAYLYNIVAHVLNRLSLLKSTRNLIHYPAMQDEIQIKIGGDHGDDSFKMGYQVANVKNPNRPSNTVVFSFFYGKDTRANLKTGLSRFKPHVAMLQKQNFEGKQIRVFMYGDYEFLTVMYGLTGANGNFKLYFSVKTYDL